MKEMIKETIKETTKETVKITMNETIKVTLKTAKKETMTRTMKTEEWKAVLVTSQNKNLYNILYGNSNSTRKSSLRSAL